MAVGFGIDRLWHDRQFPRASGRRHPRRVGGGLLTIRFPQPPIGWPSRSAAGPITTCRRLLDDPRVDVVTICTPSGAHLEPAVAAARRANT